jgi:hypothetical protein
MAKHVGILRRSARRARAVVSGEPASAGDDRASESSARRATAGAADALHAIAAHQAELRAARDTGNDDRYWEVRDDGVEVIVDGTGWQLWLDPDQGWSGYAGSLDPETGAIVVGGEDHDDERRWLGPPDASPARVVAALRRAIPPDDSDDVDVAEPSSSHDVLPLQPKRRRALIEQLRLAETPWTGYSESYVAGAVAALRWAVDGGRAPLSGRHDRSPPSPERWRAETMVGEAIVSRRHPLGELDPNFVIGAENALAWTWLDGAHAVFGDPDGGAGHGGRLKGLLGRRWWKTTSARY